MGVVTDSATGAPVAGAVVRAEWAGFRTDASGYESRADWRETRSAEDGAYRLCNLPVATGGVPIVVLRAYPPTVAGRLAARRGIGAAGRWTRVGAVEVPSSGRSVEAVPLRVSRRDGSES
jgi:hypothetical protein